MRPRLLAGLLLLAGACGGDGGNVGPRSGEVVLALSTSTVGTEAVVIRLVGEVTAITAIGSHRIVSAPVGSGTITRIVVTGPINTGDLVRLSVPDLSLLDTYTASVEQAATGVDYSLVDPALYVLLIRR